jgi:hypothetical protein
MLVVILNNSRAEIQHTNTYRHGLKLRDLLLNLVRAGNGQTKQLFTSNSTHTFTEERGLIQRRNHYRRGGKEDVST